MIIYITVDPHTVEANYSPMPIQYQDMVDQAKREGRQLRVEVGQFESQPPFLWGMEII